MNDPARLFIGIALSADARAQIGAAVDDIDAEMGSYEPHLYHLTLCFLGMTPRARMDELRGIIAALPFAPFAAALGDWGTFKEGTILWLGIKKPCEPLITLQGTLAQRLRTAGFAAEDRAYTPHITVARKVKQIHRLPAPPVGEILVGKVTLFESAQVEGRLAYLPIPLQPHGASVAK